MSSRGSVTVWIQEMQAGEEAAFAKIHARYWPLVVGFARAKLKGAAVRAADEEDVAQAALWSFYRRVKGGEGLRFDSRHAVFAFLTHLVACKAVNQIQHELGVQKRGGGQVRGGSAIEGIDVPGSREPTGLEVVLLKEMYQRMIDELSEGLREFAELHLVGQSNRQIAEQTGCVERTVERKLALIRRCWQRIASECLDEDLTMASNA